MENPALRPDMSYLSIRDLDLNGKKVFIRVDFNVPLVKNEKGEMEISSDKRIKSSIPTIQYALDHGAGVILASHLGRPKGKPRTCAITPRKRRTTWSFRRSWPRCATFTSTTRSEARTAPMRLPKAWSGSFQPPPPAC
jgi:hypothetical protein